MTEFFKKHTLITGTLLLTAAGFATKVLGFFYRIFLSRTIGAEGLGLYNMVHPVYGICFALCAGPVQTALSRLIAANVRRGKIIFRTGLIISLTIGIALSFLMIRFAQPLARYILLEDRCAGLLPFMAVSVPFSAIHACINGYYYGLQKTRVPAFAQVAEQVIRMGAVFLIAGILTKEGRPITVELAVTGHLIGEIASCCYSILCCRLFAPPEGKKPEASVGVPSAGVPSGAAAAVSSSTAIGTSSAAASSSTAIGTSNAAASLCHPDSAEPVSFFSGIVRTAPALMALALPLMGNRLIINLLSSAEAIWIPNRLTACGLTSSQAFGVYGVLTGMAMPFILFPSAITNSMAVLLLPAVAEAQSQGRQSRIDQTLALSLRYSLYMGILCIGVFTLFGDALGTSVFHEPSAGKFMEILAWLCPFLYLSTTTGSILNGLGKTGITFLQNVAALLLRIGFVLLGIPRFGITAYLWGMLASELLLALLHLWSLQKLVTFSWNSWEMIIRPALALVLSIGIFRFIQGIALPALNFPGFNLPIFNLPAFVSTSIQVIFLSACYGGLLLLSHIRKN